MQAWLDEVVSYVATSWLGSMFFLVQRRLGVGLSRVERNINVVLKFRLAGNPDLELLFSALGVMGRGSRAARRREGSPLVR